MESMDLAILKIPNPELLVPDFSNSLYRALSPVGIYGLAGLDLTYSIISLTHSFIPGLIPAPLSEKLTRK
jgi:hypothetical protein